MGARRCLRPRSCVLAGRYDRTGVARGDSHVARTRVISAFGTELANRLLRWDLIAKLGQHWRITNPATSDFNCPDHQRIGINPMVDLAPLPRLGRSVFLGKPFSFTLGFDPSAINQQVKRVLAGLIWDGDIQTFFGGAIKC